MSLFSELKRRNVFKVGVAYTIVGWLLIQITDIVAPALNLPAWTLTLIIYLVIIGFPLALFLAWAFELTPEGIKPTRSVEPTESITGITGHKLNYTIIALLSLAVIILVINNYVLEEDRSQESEVRSETTAGTPADIGSEITTSGLTSNEKSVAVLPFLDLSENRDQTWFADGVAEEILNSLARLPNLLVTSRTSSFQFRDEKQNLAEIAARLGVAHIVEGSVRRIGDDLRVTAQLIRASDGFHLWSEVYPSKTEDLFKVQHDIAEKIAAALDIVLDDTQRDRMFRTGTHNVEAFEAYQRGWAMYEAAHNPPSESTLWDANIYFERAMQLDPGYAQAALSHMDAFAHTVMEGGGVFAPNPPYSQEQALALLHKDLDFAIAHSPTQTMRIIAELNRELFSPTWYRMPALIEQLRMQPDFDSVTIEQGVWLGDILRLMDEYDLLHKMLERTRIENPLSLSSWFYMISVACETGHYVDAQKYLAEARRVLGGAPVFPIMEMILARNKGESEEAIRLLNEIVESRTPGDSSKVLMPYAPALLAAANGEFDTADRLLDEYESGTDLPDLSILEVYYEMGAADRIRALVRRIDALPGGATRFLNIFSFYGQRLMFDLKDTPNFSAMLAQAGIGPERFSEPFPRFSKARVE